MVILSIDITFDTPSFDNHQNSAMSLALQSVHKIKELQMKYTDLRAVVLIVKKLLAKYGLNKPYSGGLNSYSIVLMTSTFINAYGVNVQTPHESQNLSEFFNFLGHFFDPNEMGMDGAQFFQLTPEQQSQNEHMWILDIQNEENNTARTAFRIHEILAVFRQAFQIMMSELQSYADGIRANPGEAA
jgi:DNA polymerase sigma